MIITLSEVKQIFWKKSQNNLRFKTLIRDISRSRIWPQCHMSVHSVIHWLDHIWLACCWHDLMSMLLDHLIGWLPVCFMSCVCFAGCDRSGIAVGNVNCSHRGLNQLLPRALRIKSNPYTLRANSGPKIKCQTVGFLLCFSFSRVCVYCLLSFSRVLFSVYLSKGNDANTTFDFVR